MFDKILDRIKKGVNAEDSDRFQALFESIESYIKNSDCYVYSHSRMPLKECESYNEFKNLPAEDKLEAVISLCRRTNKYQKLKKHYNDNASTIYNIDMNLLDAIMRTRIEFPENFSFFTLFTVYYYETGKSKKNISLIDRPFGALVTQIEKQVKKFGLTKQVKNDIQSILDAPAVSTYISEGASNQYWGPDVGKAVKKLQRLLFTEDDNGIAQVPPYEPGSGKFGLLIKDTLHTLSPEQQNLWHALFHHLSSASGGKPSKKFMTVANPLIEAVGTAEFKSQANKWFTAAANIKVETVEHVSSYDGREYTYNSHEYIESRSHNLLKGLLWSMSRFHDKESLQVIAYLVEKCFQKIPEQGPAAAGVGNAGIYTLAQSKGLGGISHLSRLKLRIRQNNTQKLIQKYIDEQAKKQGIKPSQVEELAASDYGLTNGQRIEKFDDYTLKLQMTGIGATELQWFKPDGTPQKSVPAFVKSKDSLSAKLKKMRDLAKQVKQGSTTQRDRIDRLYTENISWNLEDFSKYYLFHGLVSQLACKLIWKLDDQAALFIDEQWQDVQGEPIKIKNETKIRLWHPIDSDADTVLAWRERLEVLQIKQPFKQAYREIYLLTDAEINTRIYSNRMAAHILKQHQFNSLAALRGWKYSLLGAYDDGRDGDIAQKLLEEFNLTAEFWINEILDDTDSFNDAGIWFYVATDQVRFIDANDQPVALVDIPPLILSEIMRDVDLFVGVASVGNDPQWQDGGPEGRQDYRDYWQSYSFGDLTEVAKTRKTVLEKLLPRLKIREVAKIDGKFLMVQGKKNTYKIHIGSGNILIAPNDRYLCIVPGRGKDKNVEQVFLPFEGDNGLSIVLSKAFLLAEDDKIKDPTIISQL